jgi:Amt family ammonium transporter
MMTTPALALFYGGMTRSKSVLNMMMMSFVAMGVVGIVYVLWGWSMSFGGDGTFFADPFTLFGLKDVAPDGYVGVMFQLTFAVITAALISGAIADRVKFSAWVVFLPLWVTFSYFPLAHMVFSCTDAALICSRIGAQDYAGGTAVHINAGAAALALALVLGKRVGFQKGAHKPHNVPLVLLGASILWFGWFGFNVGAEFLNDMANVGLIAVNTLGATAAAVIGWLIVEKLKDGKATSVGAGSGAVAGLVAITPSCANLAPGWALLLGLIAGVLCALAIELKFKLGFDDSLDVVGIHLVGGLIGTLYLGFFANGTGLIYSGSATQLLVQAIAAFSVLIYSFVLAWIIGFAIQKTMGFRVKNEDEIAGIDTIVHGEEGYVLADTKA